MPDNKKVLMIAFHYPPFSGSSGHHRVMSFSRNLEKYGWTPTVLTVNPRVYEQTCPDILKEIADQKIYRTFALDIAKDLAVYKRYPGFLALPDRWWTWWFSSVLRAAKIIKEENIDAIWSTFPIPTAHLIGMTLKKMTGLPWVAEFRDPMWLDGYPENNMERKMRSWVESATLKYCDKAVLVSQGAFDLYKHRYPHAKKKLAVIPNGYEESSFDGVETGAGAGKEKLKILHSGIIYETERDPAPLFKAISELRDEKEISLNDIEFVFRGCGSEEYLRSLCQSYRLEDVVIIEPLISHKAALKEHQDSAALLVMQGERYNNQIPAKVYEYFRSQRPILGLVDESGDTAAILKSAGYDAVYSMTDVPQIKQGIAGFIKQLRSGTAFVPEYKSIIKYSRDEQVPKLITILNTLV